MFKRVYVGALFLVLIGFVSSASGKPVKGKWWEDQGLVEKVKITREQQEKINKIFDESQSKRKELRDKARELQARLSNIYGQADLDQDKFDETLSKFGNVLNQLYLGMVQMKLKIRKVLTKDQIKTLLAEYPRLFNINARWAGRAGARGKRGKLKAPPAKK